MILLCDKCRQLGTTQDCCDRCGHNLRMEKQLRDDNRRLRKRIEEANDIPEALAEGGVNGIDRCHRAIIKQRAKIDRLHYIADAFVPKPQQMEAWDDRKADVFALQSVAAACEYYGIPMPQHVAKAMDNPASVLSHEEDSK